MHPGEQHLSFLLHHVLGFGKFNEYWRSKKIMFVGSRARLVRKADLTAIFEPIV
jgi:hypothetical protein